MRASIVRADELGVYVLFSEDVYEVEEFHTFDDLAAQGCDGTPETLVEFLLARIEFRKADRLTLQAEVAPDVPAIGFYVDG